jgi:adenylate kinase
MRLVFLGAPGVGKGTQAELVASQFRVPKISTGDILREAVRNKTTLGLAAKQAMDQGKLVPDEVVNGIVREKLAGATCADGFVLDGFPRTRPQAEELSKLLRNCGQKLDQVINFVVPRDEVVRRLSGRRSCPKCQAVYHVDSAPSRRPGTCDRCEGDLVQRTDDRKETVEARLGVYDQQTAPLISYYRDQGLLSDLDGSGPIESVRRRLLGLLTAKGLT